jgi:hypothetical protein
MKNKRAHKNSLCSFFPKNRKAAFEMSVGAIVTVVLSVTLLVGGIFLVSKIINVSSGVIDLTEQQLKTELGKLFSEETKVTIYPETRLVAIKQQETSNGVGIGIKNLLEGSSGDKEFSYEVTASDTASLQKCGVNKEVAEDWIVTGRTGDNINIPSGDFFQGRVLFYIPVGAPLCTMRYNVNVRVDGKAYAATDSFDVRIKAK